ncbi:hypothetical protein B566_EDAN012783 [Ephemera danica]|nr:hypothetical protein B566_EDAN012783 [Ephemera danica]
MLQVEPSPLLASPTPWPVRRHEACRWQPSLDNRGVNITTGADVAVANDDEFVALDMHVVHGRSCSGDSVSYSACGDWYPLLAYAAVLKTHLAAVPVMHRGSAIVSSPFHFRNLLRCLPVVDCYTIWGWAGEQKSSFLSSETGTRTRRVRPLLAPMLRKGFIVHQCGGMGSTCGDLSIVALTWLAFRPLLGGLLLVSAGLPLAFFVYLVYAHALAPQPALSGAPYRNI